MRFIRGESLKEAIHQASTRIPTRPGGPERSRGRGQRRSSFRQLLRPVLDVCDAIDYAHSRGVLHRDIKPANIMSGNHGETLVVDWGLAKALGKLDPRPSRGERPLAAVSAGGVPRRCRARRWARRRT